MPIRLFVNLFMLNTAIIYSDSDIFINRLNVKYCLNANRTGIISAVASTSEPSETTVKICVFTSSDIVKKLCRMKKMSGGVIHPTPMIIETDHSDLINRRLDSSRAEILLSVNFLKWKCCHTLQLVYFFKLLIML